MANSIFNCLKINQNDYCYVILFLGNPFPKKNQTTTNTQLHLYQLLTSLPFGTVSVNEPHSILLSIGIKND